MIICYVLVVEGNQVAMETVEDLWSARVKKLVGLLYKELSVGGVLTAQ